MTERLVFYPEGSIKSVLVFHWSQSLRFLVWMWFSLVNPLIDSTTLRCNSRQFQSWYRSLSEATSYIQTAEVSQSWFEGQVLRDPFAIPWRFHRKTTITMFFGSRLPMISRLSRSIEGDHEQQLPFGLPAAVGELTCGQKWPDLALQQWSKPNMWTPFATVNICKHAPIIQALKTLAMPT